MTRPIMRDEILHAAPVRLEHKDLPMSCHLFHGCVGLLVLRDSCVTCICSQDLSNVRPEKCQDLVHASRNPLS